MTKAYRVAVPDDPRQWDNLGTMVCIHPRYLLGDLPVSSRYLNADGRRWAKHNITDVDELKELVRQKHVIAMPLYLYDHSGLSISTSREYPFNCPWDAGQVGYIYVTKATVRDWFSVKKVTVSVLKQVYGCLQDEVLEYNDYLTSRVEEYDVEEEELRERVEVEGLPVQLPLLPDTPPTWEGRETVELDKDGFVVGTNPYR